MVLHKHGLTSLGSLYKKLNSLINSYLQLMDSQLKMIQKGDPYQTQVEQTVKKVVSLLANPSEDYQICYQSRVGFLPWLKPYTMDEIKRAGEQKKAVVLVPISFVAENSETLFELDIEYKELAEKAGVLDYYRVPTVSIHPYFIQGLANLVKQA